MIFIKQQLHGRYSSGYQGYCGEQISPGTNLKETYILLLRETINHVDCWLPNSDRTICYIDSQQKTKRADKKVNSLYISTEDNSFLIELGNQDALIVLHS